MLKIAVPLIAALALLVPAVTAGADGAGPNHYWVAVDVPDTVPAALVDHPENGLMFCATQDELAARGIVVDAVFGCEVAEIHAGGLVTCVDVPASAWCPDQ